MIIIKFKEQLYYFNNNIEKQVNLYNKQIKEDKQDKLFKIKLRQLKNDILHLISNDLKEEKNVFDAEYQEKVFDYYIHHYFKTKQFQELAKLELDENFLAIYQKAKKLNNEENINNKNKLSFKEMCNVSIELMNKYSKKPSTKKKLHSPTFITLLNLILSPWK